MIWWTTNRRLRKRNDQLVKQVEWLEGAMARQEEMLQELHELTRNLGGDMVELDCESIPDAIIRFAREQQATSIIMGQSVRSRLEEILRGSIITRIMRETNHLDVLIVADAET